MQGTIGTMFVNKKIIRIYSIHFIIEIYSILWSGPNGLTKLS